MITSQVRSIVRMSAVALAVSVLVPALAQADAKGDVQTAVQKLADAKSYSWASTVEGQMGGSGTGETEKDGYTTVAMTARDTTMDAVIKGDKSVIKTDDGWKTPPRWSTPRACSGTWPAWCGTTKRRPCRSATC